MARYKARFTYSATSQIKKSSYFLREGNEVYRHPKGYFITLEFQGKGGKFRESFYLNELLEV